jgi:hypothetical protein
VKSKAIVVSRYLAVTACLSRSAIDVARSRIRRYKSITCSECLDGGVKSIHGFTLESGTWQGGASSSLNASPTVVHRHHLTNMKFIPTEEFIWDPLELGPPEAAPASPN